MSVIIAIAQSPERAFPLKIRFRFDQIGTVDITNQHRIDFFTGARAMHVTGIELGEQMTNRLLLSLRRPSDVIDYVPLYCFDRFDSDLQASPFGLKFNGRIWLEFQWSHLARIC